MSTSAASTATRPRIDDPCSRHLSFRHLIACGDTFLRLNAEAGGAAAVGARQLPSSPDSWKALRGLATQILDPLIDRYSGLKLTYGFSGPWLSQRAGKPKAPRLDQHAACELNRAGRPICQRGGAAADFVVPGQSMNDVMAWVAHHLPFDRLYYYGPARSLHVSWHPQPLGLAYVMRPGSKGQLMPRRLTPDLLAALGGRHA